MTAAQRDAMHRIVRALALCKTHPSPRVRDSVAPYDNRKVESVRKMVLDALDKDDGQVAYGTIRAWHSSGEKAVIEFFDSDPITAHYRN